MTKKSAQSTAVAKAGEKLSRQRQRQKLIDACISALHQHGPSRTTIDKVVQIADMSPGIVNFYFETKAALLVAALDYLAVEFEERLLTPLASLRETPVQALRRLIELYLDPDIASPRKVSVWYAFWGEATSRHEYYEICGKRDLAFGELVRDLMARLIEQSGTTHLDADAVALGLIGSLEMIWQGIAFQKEADIDRAAARQRCMAYLASIFPEQFAARGQGAARRDHRRGTPAIPSRQPHDACVMLVVAELSLAGLPALRMPEDWPGYDVLALPRPGILQRIAVAAAQPGQGEPDIVVPSGEEWDWLCVVVLPGMDQPGRRLFVLPRAAVLRRSYGLQEFAAWFSAFEDNVQLRQTP